MFQVLLPPKPNIPEAAPGMALSVFPSGHCYWLDDFEYYDQLGRDPLQQAKIWHIKEPKDRVAKLKEVLEEYTKQKHRRAMLYEAASRGDEDLVRYLVATGLKVHPDIPDSPPSEAEEEAEQEAKENGEILDKDDPSVVPVHAAAGKGHVGCLKIMLEEGQVEVDVRDSAGRTPLIMGTKYPEVVRYLLGLGADPTARTYPDGDRINFEKNEYSGADVLEHAAAHANVEVLELLLNHPTHGSMDNRKSRAQEGPGIWVTPLSIKSAAEARDGYDALKLLLERGAYPMEAKGGETKAELLSDEEREAIADATAWAAMDGRLESLQLLLSYKYPTDLDGSIIPFDLPEELHRPFVYGAYTAIMLNQPERFEFIKSFGITEHETMSLDELPEGQKLNIQHLLDKAAEGGAVESARHMVEKYGADPNKHRMPSGVKPLYLAAANDKPEMVRFLLENQGVDIHSGSGRYAVGPTALWVAIRLKSLESVNLLLQQGGPVDHIDDEIRSISSPMKVILKAEVEGLETSVRLETEETAMHYLEKYKENWQNLNPPFVCLDIGPDDKGWITKLQPRRSSEELRETGDNARELNEAEGADDDELDDEDRRHFMVALPTVVEREDALRKDDDLLPEFKPFLVPVADH